VHRLGPQHGTIKAEGERWLVWTVITPIQWHPWYLARAVGGQGPWAVTTTVTVVGEHSQRTAHWCSVAFVVASGPLTAVA
jgi:hypothetical protein